MKARRRVQIAVAAIMALIGVGLMLYPAATQFRYSQAQAALVRQSEKATSEPSGGESGQRMPGNAIARIVIERIALDAYVLEGTEPTQLNEAVGHYRDTALPGEQGNASFAGHRTMYGHPFRHLDRLRAGDTIETWTETAHATYRVIRVIRVAPSRTDVIEPVDGHRITLTTCNPVGSARERLVVIGELVK